VTKGDLFDIKPAVLAGVHREDFSKMTPDEASEKLQVCMERRCCFY
jgi:hypothetical protein